MANDVMSYVEMCTREGCNLQQGMNFRLGKDYSVILMSVRPGAPYRDRVEEEGMVLIYEGHDQPKRREAPDPKTLDQPERRPSGSLTQNGLFYQAAQSFKKGEALPERVRVYEKIRGGIWSFNGPFLLLDSWQESDGKRQVFKFKLKATSSEDEQGQIREEAIERSRVIPTLVKLEVWKRDNGKCVICGAGDELHFDHIVPYSKGGTSLAAANVQLLCARHNLAKRDKIE